ncbi:MAG: ChaN family lipoprotein [Betaproteobacteria bacterium]|nr:ChaN family lipoprotein [Betaproteobacteria bacterium]
MNPRIPERLRSRAIVTAGVTVATVAVGAALVLVAALIQDSTARAAERACLSPSAWHALTDGAPQVRPASQLVAAALRSRVVLLGEQHDNADHHRWQLGALTLLHAAEPDMAIGFEMFPRSKQPVLERWVRGQLGEAQFLKEVEWGRVWRYDPGLYMPLFQFARMHRIPMIALNADRDAADQPIADGIGRPAAASPAYRKELKSAYALHPKRPGVSEDEAFRRFVDTQLLWDRAMAEGLAGAAGKHKLVVGVMGGGHVRDRHGVPRQLADLGAGTAAVWLPVAANSDCNQLPAAMADAVFALPASPDVVVDAPPRKPRLGVIIALSGAAAGATIENVSAGSVAEAAGIRSGDRVVTAAGQPVRHGADLIAAVGRQPDGTWLPLEIERGAERLALVARFPPVPETR